MTGISHLNSLYAAAKIILWVEDSLTRDYLAKGWGDPAEIAFLISGGNSSIRPAVQAAERDNYKHVFGLVDRDFGYTNYTSWNTPSGSRIFTLPRHEIENYALDANAIAGCSLNNRSRSVSDIEDELQRLAKLQPTWLACRRVLVKIRETLQHDYPSHPSATSIPTIADAESHIVSSQWFGELPLRSYRWTTPGTVRAELHNAEAEYLAELNNGDWFATFSGKEIFRRVRDFVYQPPQKPGSPDNDFAKAIGDWQLSNNLVPADLIDLRQALRARVGL